MTVVEVPSPGGPDVLVMGARPRPVAGPGELVVRVHATALNRADLLQRAGKYPPPAGESDVLGLEIAGTVEDAGPGCEHFDPGARVFGLLGGGGYAEFAILREDAAMPVPETLSMEEAAAIPEAFLTAYQALVWYGRVATDDHVLIHAGASGVGTAGIQVAREFGATVYVTASSGKHASCLDLGAERAIDYRSESFLDVVREESDGRGVDVIVDFIGAPYLSDNVAALAVDGRLVILATMGGSRVADFNLRDLFRKRGQINTSTLRNRSNEYKARLTRDFAAFALARFEDGRLRPVIDSVFDWRQVVEAHQRMEQNLNTGKIILRISSET